MLITENELEIARQAIEDVLIDRRNGLSVTDALRVGLDAVEKNRAR